MMRPIVSAVGVCACVAAVAVSAQHPQTESRMTNAAKAFLATLDADQKKKVIFPFSSEERVKWGFVPSEVLPWKHREGLTLKAMNGRQREAALDLLHASLGPKGSHQADTIRELEKVLHAQEMGRGLVRDPENYYFCVFGEPSDSATWGWRYEGHHCSQNFTVVHGRQVASSPQFFGSNPAEVRQDVPGAPPRGTRVLGRREDLGRELVKGLPAGQQSQAILDPKAPGDITTMAQRSVSISENKGLPYGKMDETSRKRLVAVIREYADTMPRDLADQRMAAIRKAGMDTVTFAWMGSTEPGQGHYYKVQGPTFLIEYDNTQNNANHVHSVWRDYKGDFGMDMLAMHYKAFHRVAAAR